MNGKNNIVLMKEQNRRGVMEMDKWNEYQGNRLRLQCDMDWPMGR